MSDSVAAEPRGHLDFGRVRLFFVPLALVVGLAASFGVFQTLSGNVADNQVLNTSFLLNRLLSHLLLSGVSFGIVAVIGVGVGIVIAGGGRALRFFVFLLANLGQAVPGI